MQARARATNKVTFKILYYYRTMLKKEDKILIRTAMMEYRNLLFKTFHGTDEEKNRIAHVNKFLRNWQT